jgi:hypothetical protein
MWKKPGGGYMRHPTQAEFEACCCDEPCVDCDCCCEELTFTFTIDSEEVVIAYTNGGGSSCYYDGDGYVASMLNLEGLSAPAGHWQVSWFNPYEYDTPTLFEWTAPPLANGCPPTDPAAWTRRNGLDANDTLDSVECTLP